MIYIPFLIAIIAGLYLYFAKRDKADNIRSNGTRVTGVLLQNLESMPNSFYRLGGNINNSLISFTTENGMEITGSPASDFITQTEVKVPCSVYIIYNNTNPQEFLLDGFA
ncbi:MAG: hypothetical protein ABIP30_13205 [Ferruginibacter sp.]